MKRLALATVACLVSVPSMASSITVLATQNSYGGPYVAPLFPFGLGSGTPNSLQTSAPVTDSEGVIYTFTGAGSGEFAGSVASVSQSPLGSGDATTNYLTAAGGGGVVTVTWPTPQTSIVMNWGSVDSDPGRNIVLSGSTMITGLDIQNTMVAQGFPLFCNGCNDTWLRIDGLSPFTTATFSDGSAPAFEFGLDTSTEGAPGPTLGSGLPTLLLGLSFIGWRRYRRLSA